MGKTKDGAKNARCDLTEILSKEEIRFRKVWVGVLVFRMLSLAICGDWNYSEHVICALISVADTYVLYRLAYQKPGTSVLAFHMMFFAPCYALRAFLYLFVSLPNLYMSILALMITGVFCAYTMRMRNINKKIQICEFIKSDYYLKSVEYVRSAQELDSLSDKFHEVFRKCPGHFAAALAPLYDEMKRHLSKQIVSEI